MQRSVRLSLIDAFLFLSTVKRVQCSHVSVVCHSASSAFRLLLVYLCRNAKSDARRKRARRESHPILHPPTATHKVEEFTRDSALAITSVDSPSQLSAQLQQAQLGADHMFLMSCIPNPQQRDARKAKARDRTCRESVRGFHRPFHDTSARPLPPPLSPAAALAALTPCSKSLRVVPSGVNTQ